MPFWEYQRHLAENLIYLGMTCVWIAVDALRELWSHRGSVLNNTEAALKFRLREATAYEEWREIARQLDVILGNDQWRADPVCTDYDHKLIASRLQHLSSARANHDVSTMIYGLRAGLLRNLGGLTDSKLFSRSLLGTKHLIEDYTDEMLQQLQYLADCDIEGFSHQAKIDFFNDTRQGFGNSALLLHGGATFGMYHLGVVKCLNAHSLLPRIISGTSVGALIGALVCVHMDKELPEVFQSSGIDLKAFKRVGTKGSIRRKLFRLIKQGYLMDVTVLDDCVRCNVGDVTFEEAYRRTKRILNIVVSSTRKNEVPRLLNYLTAPNVLIRSAACASCAVTGLYDTVSLLAKDHNGNIVPWNQHAIKWSDASMDIESPTARLSELFNVNHAIMSQANPHMLPFVSRKLMPQQDGFVQKITALISLEVRHRLYQLNEFGLLPSWMKGFTDQQLTGNVTIYPDIKLTDYQVIFTNPTSSTLDHWILKGEQATWPQLALIKNRCAIELALDRILLQLRNTNTNDRQLRSS